MSSANTETFKLNCPSCSKLLKVPTKFAGKSIKCPHCEMKFQVPDFQDPPESSDEQESSAPRKTRRTRSSTAKRGTGKQKQKSKQTPLIVGIVIIVLGVAAFFFMNSESKPNQNSGWVDQSMNNDKCTYAMPAKPREEFKQDHLPQGESILFEYTLKIEDIEYTASFNDFPDGYSKSIGVPQQFLYDRGRDSVLSSPAFRLEKEEPFELHGQPGRRIYYKHIIVENEKPKLYIMRQDVIMINDDLYVFQSLAPKELADSENVKKFHDSVNIAP